MGMGGTKQKRQFPLFFVAFAPSLGRSSFVNVSVSEGNGFVNCETWFWAASPSTDQTQCFWLFVSGRFALGHTSDVSLGRGSFSD